MPPLDYGRIAELRELCAIPSHHGQQWITPLLNLLSGRVDLHYSFNWKLDMGVCEGLTLEEALTEARALRRKACL